MRINKLIVSGIFLICALLGSVYAVGYPNALERVASPGSAIERMLAKLPFVDRLMCISIPRKNKPFDSLTKDEIKRWAPQLRYVTNPGELSLESGPEDERSSLRQRYTPSSRGSLRVAVSINLEPRFTYEVEQSFLFESGFDWGGEAESGKFGFGLAGGSAPTGGKLDKDGFSARLLWKGNGDGSASVGAYLYSVDRTHNLPYGDEFVFSESNIPIGEWFRIKMRLTSNSTNETSDGSIQVWIDDQLHFDRREIQWQSAGQDPVIDQVLYSSFHGGNTQEWSPEEVVHSRVADICVFKDRGTTDGG